VAEAAIEAGASLVNDISASLAPVAAAGGVGWVAMHCQGTPQTMQHDPRYRDVVAEVADVLRDRLAWGLSLGVAEVWLDPGIGFGKTGAHNLSLLRHLDVLVDLGAPVLVGTSRKSFLGRLSAWGSEDPSPVDDRLEASVATAVWAIRHGAAMVRVHDVAPTVQAARVAGGGGRAPVTPAGSSR
ncbi:MAG TPA: dihydropteroate synthase, partial [Acidimicrobiales bacterium]|nr:dihydropteroate synthase [Acidimicrobiales bacterium]